VHYSNIHALRPSYITISTIPPVAAGDDGFAPIPLKNSLLDC
jgi:hypothetical protein